MENSKKHISKENIIESINEAKADLETALEGMEHLPVFDDKNLGFAAQALNNYLSIIGGVVYLLKLSLKDYPDKDVHMRLDGLEHASNLMTHTVNQLMGSATTGQPKLMFSNVDLSLLVKRVCNYYQRTADRKQIRITFENSLQTSLHVWTDRVAVAAVLDNLMSNAIKYSERGKQILVQVKADIAHCFCIVKDEGPGLNAEDQTKLFQQGARLSPVPTGGEPSTGYGLAVAKELIDQLGGEIWCESQLGKGSSFSFQLPLNKEKE